MLLGLTSHSQDCASIFCFPFQPVLFIFEVYLIHDAVLASGVPQSDSVVPQSDSVVHIYIYIYVCVCVCVCVFFFRFFFLIAYHKILSIVPCI